MDRAKALGADQLIPEDFLHIDQFVRLHHQPGKHSPQSLVAEWRALLAQRPDSFLGHYYAGLTYQFIAKDLDLALQHLQKSVDLNPNYPRSLFALGDAQREAKRFDQARTTWNKLVAIEPDDADYLCNLGILNYRDLNNTDAAVARWQQALAVDPDHQDSHYNLSVSTRTLRLQQRYQPPGGPHPPGAQHPKPFYRIGRFLPTSRPLPGCRTDMAAGGRP